MSSALWALSLPIGSALVFIPRFISAALQVKSGEPLKLSNPRAQIEGDEVASKDVHGYVRRAYSAHQNSFEAMILWSTAVLLARTSGVSTDTMNLLAGLWLTARVVYIASYILIASDTLAVFRSVVFMVGLVATLTLMWEAALED